MHLTLTQIQSITLGANRVEQDTDGFTFHRFSAKQEELYLNRWYPFYMRCLGTSGVRLRFRTNSQTLMLKTSVSPAVDTRNYFSFDVFVNGEMYDTLTNFSKTELPQNYTTQLLNLGEFSKEFYLGKGLKEVCIYLPWSVKVSLTTLALDDDSILEPVKPSKKLLCFGDSITQGYDALYPSNKYISKLADFLDAEEYNKAVGGDWFFPELVSEKENFDPDYITVAYGTNDWSSCSREAFVHNCKTFFHNLSQNYPNAKIFAITPIWRKDHTEEKPFGSFEDVANLIEQFTASLDNIFVIPGYHFVNHEEIFYGDLRLHPNDAGFEQYFKNLSKEITNILAPFQEIH